MSGCNVEGCDKTSISDELDDNGLVLLVEGKGHIGSLTLVAIALDKTFIC